jgi:cytochrome c oxidase subunit 2
MGGTITVMEPLDYQAWLAGERPGQAAPASGEELFASLACSTCHRADSAVIAPKLHGAFGKEAEMANGEIVLVDENYLRESILEPAAKVVKGYRPVMPTYQGQISEEQLMELIAYIKSIGDESAGDTAAEPAAAAAGEDGEAETARG